MDQTDYRYNLEYRGAVHAQMLALAKGLIAGDLGVIAAARQLHGFLDIPDPEISVLIDLFTAIRSDTDALPIGEERSLWNSEALAREDKKVAAAEQCWRPEAIIAATQLVRILEQDVHETRLGRPYSASTPPRP